MFGWLFQTRAEMERECEMIRKLTEAKIEQGRCARAQYEADQREKQELKDKIDRILKAIESR